MEYVEWCVEDSLFLLIFKFFSNYPKCLNINFLKNLRDSPYHILPLNFDYS